MAKTYLISRRNSDMIAKAKWAAVQKVKKSFELDIMLFTY